jgi:localization factor PodJL
LAATNPPAADVTGSVPRPDTNAAPDSTQQPAIPAIPLGPDSLPAAIGSPGLRSAAVSGNPAAEYEIAVRYAEGRGVSQSFSEAARWFERAAKQGITPAQYRLGSLYEKGHGVKKDLEAARRLYLEAADKGSAKAMHNLAVLFAEGIDGKPDYKAASQWFRKAAAHGVADSQYNLGILYARGIGVEQNLAESYKWFALAAQQGDQDAGRKRDDVAARLDSQSLVAAKLAAQTFAVAAQPEEATMVKSPPGGWDRPAATAPAAPASAKPKAAPRRTGST